MSNPFERVRAELEASGFEITESTLDKPWGGYYRIAEAQKAMFIEKYFGDYSPPVGNEELALTPKILMVAPGGE